MKGLFKIINRATAILLGTSIAVIGGLSGSAYATQPPTLAEYYIPTSYNASLNFVRSIAQGSDGNMWFMTDLDGIRSISPSGSFGSVPQTLNARGSELAAGVDGNIWIVDNQLSTTTQTKIIKYSPTSGILAQYNVPNFYRASTLLPEVIRDIQPGQNGMWFSANGSAAIGYVSFSGQFSYYAPAIAGGSIQDIAASNDGTVWYNQLTSGAAVDYTSTNPNYNRTYVGIRNALGVVSSYSIPPAAHGYITTDDSGNLWSVGQYGLVRVTPQGQQEFHPLPQAFRGDILLGSDGAVWFTQAATIGRYDISTAKYSFFPIPVGPNATANQLSSDASGNLWYTQYNMNRVGKVNIPVPPTSTQLSVTKTANGNVLSWTSDDEHKPNRVYRDGVYLGGIPGGSTTYTDSSAAASVGDHEYLVVAYYGGTNPSELDSGTPSNIASTADSPPSVVATISPLPNSSGWNNSEVTVSYACEDNNAISSCSSPELFSQEGVFSFLGTAVDDAGNTAQTSGQVSIDLEAPTINYNLSPTPNSEGWNDGQVTVTFTCDDALSGVQYCAAPQTITADGVTDVTGTATDNAGNTASVTATVRVDTVAPTITFEAESNSWTNGTTVEYECVDGGTTTTNTAPIVTNPDGSTTATGTCTDSAGNTTSETIPVQVDTSAPNTDYTVDSPTYNQATGWSRGPVTVTFTCSDPGGAQASGIASCSDPVTVTAEGTTVVTGTAVDVAGNSTQVNVFVNIDSVEPDITATVTGAQTNGWYTENATVTFTCADATSGVANCPQPVTVSADGTHNISGTATDVAGNSKTISVDVNIDKTAPTIEYTLASVANALGWHNGDVLVTFACSDATSGVATCTDPVTVSAEGSTGITGTATDNAGYTTEVLVFVNVDKTDPTISPNLTSANPQVNGWYTSDVTTDFTCDDTLSGVQSCVSSETAPLTNDGRYTVTGTATDNADNTATTAAQTVNIDKTAPILGIPGWTTNPLPAGGSTTIDVPAVDATSGIAQAEFFVGDTDPGVGNATPMTIANPWVDADGAVTSANLVATFGDTLQPGIYPITVRAQDVAGNWQLEVVDNLVVFDATGPTDVAMSKKAVPKLADGDVLPGLLSDSQNGQADLAFDVAYTTTGSIDSLSNLTLDYANKQGCKNIKPGCVVTSFTASTVSPEAISWLTINGDGSSVGTFQGVGTLAVETDQGVTTTTNPFKVTATDGNRTTPVSSDTAVLYIYATGANPATATPLYQYHVSANGNWMKIQ